MSPFEWFALSILFAAGGAATLARLARARSRGLSIRLQVLLALASASSLASAGLLAILLGPRGLLEALRSATFEMGLMLFALAAATALLAAWIGRRLARPLERLTAAAGRIAAGARQAPLPIPEGREVRALTRAFESMRAELEERHLFESFAADLSHELKNPVATIRASAEILEDAIVEDPDAARSFAQRIGESALRLSRLIDEMLALARLEAHGIGQERASLELGALIEEALRDAAPRALAAGVRLEPRLGRRIRVLGDARWLRRAVENLIDNGITHSPEGSALSVRLEARSGQAELTVEDRGAGVDPSLADHVFERFVSTRHHAGGTGLGLAIVRAVAESHGGRAELLRSGDAGAADAGAATSGAADAGAAFAMILPAA
ncbi:MAG: ATP-binding protein [Myxococcales bacterium]|nr:ATP-binding protein [Myxococcales bacterium]